MEIYTRQKSVQINLVGEDRLAANAVFKDSVHEIKVMIEISIPDSIIRDAQVEFISCPWDLCYEATQVMPRLVGLKLGRGLRKTVKEAVAASDGCSHLGDLMGEVLKGLIQAQFRLRYHYMGPEERAEAVRQDLKGTCRSFSDTEREPVPLGDWTTVSMKGN